MAVTVETLEKLERKITLTLPVGTIQSEVEARLKKIARTTKMDGFRPDIVPMNVVTQRYGYSVHYEVMNDKIDGEVFAGGKAEDFQFIVADGQMLKEFEDATRGMKAGESKTFQLAFPAEYHGKDVAGKTADFMVTLKKVEAAHLPEVNEALAKSLGIADATVEGPVSYTHL